jgi:hypothetical protein
VTAIASLAFVLLRHLRLRTQFIPGVITAHHAPR